MAKASKLHAVHKLEHVRCVEPGCKDLHWVCACGGWQGSRVLNAATNHQEWREHVEEALLAA